MEMIFEEVDKEDRIIVFFDEIARDYLSSKDEIENNFDITLVKKYTDGAIYKSY